MQRFPFVSALRRHPAIVILAATLLLCLASAAQDSQIGREISETARRTWESVEQHDPRKLSAGQIFSLVIIGALVGSVAGIVLTSKPKGFGAGLNFLLGLAGAFLGAVIVDAFSIDLGLGAIVISYETCVAAFAVSIIAVLLSRLASALWQHSFKGSKGAKGGSDK